MANTDIVLNKAVSEVKPIKCVSTPTAETETQLGMVGYPGDLGSGNFISTSTKSGSPVLMNDASTAVHVGFGFPNIDSVVGPADNKLAEYILALAVISGEKSVHAVKLAIKTEYNFFATGFYLVRVEPGALKKSAESMTDLTGHALASDMYDEDNSESRDTDEDEDSESAPESGDGKSLLKKQIGSLWGRHPAKHREQFNKLSVMHFPERLVLEESDDQTTFFVGFPPSNLDTHGTEKLKEL
ncbi:uncharacterized protein KY384_002195 [Bacidia gigantensis]|uniref:uncharacterized protein n=1 Tax=Bacidia gigantensis TaxID=2732470 RepID=UPI001D045F5B|nr:uncharacterized protein KY384_002195 [Bacidia gigantensis]KAG8533412.1 hypothetical protein KY384_002195 [Bacidia gigantensis]